MMITHTDDADELASDVKLIVGNLAPINSQRLLEFTLNTSKLKWQECVDQLYLRRLSCFGSNLVSPMLYYLKL